MRDVRAGLRRRVVRQRAKVLRALGRRGLVPGLLSIVVPAYNVEEYIDECLRSLRQQNYGDIEIVVVDDGSPDGSRAIAESHAAVDRRVRVVSRPNGGLSAARNAGVAAARGEFLTFVDSDDRVELDAFSTTIESLRSSGSDFAVTLYRRLRRGRSGAAGWWIRRVHEEPHIGVDLVTFPDAMVNAVAWSKVYRRQFYDEAGLSFPVGMLYEDQPVSMRAFAHARAFDVLSHVGVQWRMRDDRSSISQQSADPNNLRGHSEAVQASLAELRDAGRPEAVVRRAVQLLNHNMPFFVRHNVSRDPVFFEELRRAVAMLLDLVPRERFISEVGVYNKVLYELIQSGSMDAAAEFQEQVHPSLARYPTTLAEGVVVVDLGPSARNLEIPAEALRLADAETSLRTWSTRLSWSDAHTLRVEGWAFPERVDLSGTEPKITLVAVAGDGSEVPFAVSSRADPEADIASGSWYADATSGGFVAELNTRELPDRRGSWKLRVGMTVGGLDVSAPLRTRPWVHAGVRRPLVEITGRAVIVERNRDGLTYLRTSPALVAARSTRIDGDLVEVEVEVVADGLVSAHLAADDLAVPVLAGATRSGGASGPTVLRFDLGGLPAMPEGLASRLLRVAIVTDRGRSVPVVDLPDAAADVHSERDSSLGAVGFSRAVGGALALVQRRHALRIEAVRVRGEAGSEELILEASMHGVALADCRPLLVSPGVEVVGDIEPAAAGRHRIRFPLTRSVWGRNDLVLPSGQYQVRLDVGDEQIGGAPAVPLLSTLPLSELHTRLRTTVEVYSPVQPGVRLVVAAPLRDDERSSRQQVLLRRSSRVAVADSPSVFFRTLYGENTSGNALGVHDELRRRSSNLVLGWSTRDYSVPLPQGGTRLLEQSREWHEAIARSRYHFVDVHQPDWFERPEGQDLVQTMHGYPYKVMGHEWWAKGGFPPQQVASYDRRARDWTHFVSPAAYATPLLTAAFLAPADASPRVLEIGYPRNDALLRPESSGLRQKTRDLLGVGPDQVVVMYAPTFRDYLSADDNTALRPDFFDPHSAVRDLPSNYVVLMRGHAFHARLPGERESDGDRVIDVTDYPDVNDLILASDVAILDYSSLRFDYSLVDKPMIFLVPDLREYDALRGGVMDYGPTAPGPHVRTTGEVIEQLEDISMLRARYAASRSLFRANYLELEDGRAAERLVDAVFAPRGD